MTDISGVYIPPDQEDGNRDDRDKTYPGAPELVAALVKATNALRLINRPYIETSRKK
jgi:hypothetical protein